LTTLAWRFNQPIKERENMTDFVQGDKIRLTLKDEPEASRTIWLVEDPERGELFTYDGTDPFAPQVPLSVVLDDEDIEIALETPFNEALPTVPGEYEDRIREEAKVDLRSIEPDFPFSENSFKPWVLNEDGTWTSPDGETRPATDNWLLVVHGFEFFPWEDASVRS
jgi:hypothetical protein